MEQLILDPQTLKFFLVAQLFIVPAIMGLVQGLKNAGMNAKYAPIVSSIMGAGSSLLFGYNPIQLLIGILAGLAAVGLYEMSKVWKSPPTLNIPLPPPS